MEQNYMVFELAVAVSNCSIDIIKYLIEECNVDIDSYNGYALRLVSYYILYFKKKYTSLLCIT